MGCTGKVRKQSFGVYLEGVSLAGIIIFVVDFFSCFNKLIL